MILVVMLCPPVYTDQFCFLDIVFITCASVSLAQCIVSTEHYNRFTCIYDPIINTHAPSNRVNKFVFSYIYFCTALILGLVINWIYTTRLNDINVDYSVRNYEDHSTESVSAHKNLKALRRTNTNRIIIGHLNINSIRNKFDDLRNLITQNVDILLISETKLDASFTPKQFYLENYSPPYRLDRLINGGGLILYI